MSAFQPVIRVTVNEPGIVRVKTHEDRHRWVVADLDEAMATELAHALLDAVEHSRHMEDPTESEPS